MRVICKDTVRFKGFTAALARIIAVLDEVAGLSLKGVPSPLVITSGSDSVHAPTSAHYRGEALDLRTHNCDPLAKPRLMAAIRDRLGPQFFVDLEHLNEPAEHLHIQLRKGAVYP